MFVCDVGVVDESSLSATQREEGRGFVLVDPLRLDDVTIPRLANRIRQALSARETGGMVEAVIGITR